LRSRHRLIARPDDRRHRQQPDAGLLAGRPTIASNITAQLVRRLAGPKKPDAALGLGLGGGPGAPVIVADLSELIVKLDVDELDISRVRPGQQAIIKAQGLKDIEFDGVVEKVGLMGRDAMGAVLFSVEVKVTGSRATGSRPMSASGGDSLEGQAPVVPAAADVLRPGMSAQAEIEVERLEKATAIPLAAILEAQKSDEGEQPDRVVVVEGLKSERILNFRFWERRES
jgi:HlyD family secretion protein